MPSPISEVPDEILREIFSCCLPEIPRIDILPSKAPVVLTRVSKHWRRVAMDFARLWTSLKLPFHKRSTLACSNLEGVAEVLKRSKGGLTFLQIALGRNLSAPTGILGVLLVPFTASLTRLVLSRLPLSLIHSLPSGLFPSLHRLVLNFDKDDYEQSRAMLSKPIAAFEATPALRCLALNKLSLIESLRIPWHQLTHFVDTDRENSCHAFFTKFLPQCRALVCLSVTLCDPDVYRPHVVLPVRRTELVIMEKVRSLSLNFWGSRSGSFKYTDFFRDFKFPGLRSLRLEGSDLQFNYQDQSQVNAFITKLEQEFQLEYFSMCHGFHIPRESLERLFKATPHVTTFDAQVHLDYGYLFEALIMGPDSTRHVLPQLRTVVVEIDTSDRFNGAFINEPKFASFLESRMRCSPESRLQKIVLYGRHEGQLSDDRSFVQTIKRYLSEGLILERRVVGEERMEKLNSYWMERDPELEDWPEANAVT